MNTWGTLLIIIVVATAIIIVLALLATLTVSHFAQGFSEKTRKRYLRRLQTMLPGEDCGGCQCRNCDEYARKVFYGEAEPDRCIKGDTTLPDRLMQWVEEFQELLEK